MPTYRYLYRVKLLSDTKKGNLVVSCLRKFPMKSIKIKFKNVPIRAGRSGNNASFIESLPSQWHQINFEKFNVTSYQTNFNEVTPNSTGILCTVGYKETDTLDSAQQNNKQTNNNNN